MKIVNLGHACYMLKTDTISVVIDPYRDRSVPNLKLPRIEANYVLCSHDHYDHDAKNLIKIVPTSEKLNYKIIVVPHDHHRGAHRGLNKRHIFDIDGYRIIHTGDLGCVPPEDILEEMKNADVLLAPINGYYTISAKELKEIMDIVNPKVAIPMHYFKKDRNSGYPDGGQIDEFKSLVGDYLEVDGYEIDVDDNLFKNRVVIFKKELQE